MVRRFAAGLAVLTLFGCASAPSGGSAGTGSFAARSRLATPAAVPTTTAPTTAAPAAAPAAAAPAPAPAASTCGTATSDSYQRPFAANAPWNVPVCGLSRSDRSDDWRDRFWYYARLNGHMADNAALSTDRGTHDVLFGLDNDPAVDFSMAVYDARQATTQIRVFQRQGWGGTMYPGNATTIPWNPSWKASTGSDATMAIVDPTTGREWDLWGVVQSYPGIVANDTECWPWRAAFYLPGGGYVPGQDLCVGSANLVRNAGLTSTSDYRTYGGNNPAMRGVGIADSAMVVTPDEVSTGQIRHALMMPVFNTMTGGTNCNEAQAATPAFGVTCGGAVAPAGNFERASSSSPGCGVAAAASLSADGFRSTTVPEGSRFALRMSDGEIDVWLNSRGYAGAKRATARAFAKALVDYGWFVTDTTCYGADFQVASGRNPVTAEKWRSLGITGDGRDLLAGLFTKDRIWTVAPPTNHCIDGHDSKLACAANSITY